MSNVRVEQPHSKSLEEARTAVAGFEDQIKKYGMKANWNGNHADLKGTGASGAIDISTSKVVVEIKLGMLARAAGIDGARLQESIRKRLAEALG